MIETEVRFKAGGKELKRIEKLGARLVSDYDATDTYFTYGDPKDRRFVLRIRVGKGLAMLTFKTSARAGRGYCLARVGESDIRPRNAG